MADSAQQAEWSVRNGEPSWTAFFDAYHQAEQRQGSGGSSEPVTARAARLIAALARGDGAVQPDGDGSSHAGRSRRLRGTGLDDRARSLAAKVVAALAVDPGGLAGCLERAGRGAGFDWLRDRLDERLPRSVSWGLSLALRRQGLAAEPDRPFLDRESLVVARYLLQDSVVHAHSVRELEVLLMLEAEDRSGTPRRRARLDAELVSIACATLAATVGVEPEGRHR